MLPDALLSRPYVPDDVAGQRILCLGLGGGADAITACLWAERLTAAGAEAHYANAKRDLSGDLIPLSAHLSALSGLPVPLTGRDDGTRIDAALPRGAGGSPLVVRVPRRPEPGVIAAIGAEIRARGYDRVVGIDNGGDILRRHRRGGSRDFQSLCALRETGLPCTVVVFGLCSDGTAPRRITDQLARFDETTYRGAFPLAPMQARLAALSAGLKPTRTPRLMLDALAAPEGSAILVLRGARPTVARAWLCSGFVFESAPFFSSTAAWPPAPRG